MEPKESDQWPEEIIVTAQRRADMSLVDTPISITAITPDDMAKQSLVSLGDYLNAVPGVTASPSSGGTLNDLTFRGLGGFSGADATVGVYLGEVPLTSPQYAVFGSDVRLVDMARVEVLRGPNGTLYGASSLSGTLRYIPNAPDPSGSHGSVSAGYGATKGGDPNYKATGYLNWAILEGTLALRIAAYDMHYGGYYDNVATQVPIAVQYTQQFGGEIKDRENMGAVDVEGVRAMLLWQPADRFQATLMYMYQDVFQDGAGRSWPSLGSYKAVEFPVPTQYSKSGWPFYRDTINLANLVLEYDLGWGDVISSTSYMDGGFMRANTFTPPRGIGKLGQYKRDSSPREATFQEVRLTSKFDLPFQFSSGYFYQDSKDDDDYNFVWMGGREQFPTTTGLRVFTGQRVFNPDAISVYWENSSELKQNAFFSEVYYDIIPSLTVTLGGRYFEYDKVKGSGAIHDVVDPAAAEQQLTFDTSSENGTVYRANVKYSLTDSSTVYAEWGQGFRVGRPGANPTSGASCDEDGDGVLDGTNARLDQDILSDRTESTELGAKLRFLDGRIGINAAVYHIDWTDLPTKVFSPVPGCVASVTLNTGNAVSEGVELETQIYLTKGLRLDLGGSLIDAELSQDDPSIGAKKGDPLPRAADTTWKVGLEYEFDAFGFRSNLGGRYYYVSEYYADITRRGQLLGDYNVLDLHLGMEFGAYRFQLYGSNLTGGDSWLTTASEGGTQLPPRTIGVDFTYDFGR